MSADSCNAQMNSHNVLSGSISTSKTEDHWYSNPTILILGGMLLFYVVLYILPLGYRPLIIPDEARYAEISREMLSTDDWITPHLLGLRYFEKPPLGYWLNAISIAALGENEFAVRLPGALAAGLTSLIVFVLTLRIWGSRRVALIATLIHMTCLEVFIVGTFSVLDNFVTLFLTFGVYSFYTAASRANKLPGGEYQWVLSGVSFGLAFLSKGFIAFAVPALVLIPWILWQGNWKILVTKGWLVILAALLVASPWAILIHLHEGDFWRYFIWVEHIKRFTSETAQHKQPIYYFLMYLPVLAFPWLSVMPATIAGLRDAGRVEIDKQGEMRFLWLWMLLPFIFFSASSGKLPAYILPCFPPFAVLSAIGLTEYFKAGRDRLFDFGILLNSLVLLCLFAAIIISQTVDIGIRVYDENELGKYILIASLLFLGASSGFSAVLATRAGTKQMLSILMVALPSLALPFVVPNETTMHKSPGALLMMYRRQIADNTIIITDSSMMHAVGWYLKREDVYLINGGEARYGLEYPDATQRSITRERFELLLKEKSPKQTVLLVCKSECPGQLTSLLPPVVSKHNWGVFTFWFVPETRDSQTTSSNTQ